MKIYFEQSSGNVLINKQQWTINNHCIELDIPQKWQVLEFKSDSYLKIQNIELDGQKINYLLLIMFDQNQRCTWGDLHEGSVHYLPIHPNYAVFRSTVCQQLPNGWYGKQIYEHFEFCIDKSVEFKTPQPKHIQDYFALNTGVHWIKKYHKDSSWFFNETHDVSQLKQSIDHDLFEIDPPVADTNTGWNMRNLKNPSIDKLKQLGLTFLVDLAKKHKFTSIVSVSCNTLESGGHIGIHVDNDMGKARRKKIYLNLDPSDDVYFKFATTGLVPMNTQKSIWINTDGHVHAVVNDSTMAREIISISGEAEWPH
jgi:hypothetical protein